MFDIDQFDQSSFWEESSQIKLYIEPLTAFLGITYFDYARFYKDQTCIAYFSDRDYVSQFIHSKDYIPPTLFLTPGKHLWQHYIPIPLFHRAHTLFNFHHGITVYNQFEDHAELYNFAGPETATNLTYIYLNKFELLDSFISVFKEKINQHISRNFTHRIKLPSHYLFHQKTEPITTEEIKKYYDAILSEKKTRQAQKIVLFKNKPVALSPREFQCLGHLLKGRANKLIAQMMNISVRTAETYCEHIYRKFDCQNRNQLIIQLQQGYLLLHENI